MKPALQVLVLALALPLVLAMVVIAVAWEVAEDLHGWMCR